MAVSALWLLQGVEWHVPGHVSWLFIGALALGALATRVAAIGAIRYIGSGQVALLSPLSALLAVFWSILFLSEQFSLVLDSSIKCNQVVVEKIPWRVS